MSLGSLSVDSFKNTLMNNLRHRGLQSSLFKKRGGEQREFGSKKSSMARALDSNYCVSKRSAAVNQQKPASDTNANNPKIITAERDKASIQLGCPDTPPLLLTNRSKAPPTKGVPRLGSIIFGERDHRPNPIKGPQQPRKSPHVQSSDEEFDPTDFDENVVIWRDSYSDKI